MTGGFSDFGGAAVPVLGGSVAGVCTSGLESSAGAGACAGGSDPEATAVGDSSSLHGGSLTGNGIFGLTSSLHSSNGFAGFSGDFASF